MAIQDLMQAFSQFGEAAQEYGATRGIEDATKAVQQITADKQMDMGQKLEQQNIIAQQLQSRLAGLNRPQAQIAAAVGSIAPSIPKTSAEARQKAFAATNKEDQMFWESKADIMEQMTGKGELAEKLPLLQQEQDFALERLRVQNAATQKAASIKAELSLGKEEQQRLFEVSRQYEEKATPIRQAIRQAGTARQLLASGNPVGESAAINGLVKASGDTGVITEADREAFGGSKAYLSRLNRAASQATKGKLDKESRDFLIQVANVFEQKQAKELENYADRFTGRVVNAVGVDKEKALSIVDPEIFERRKASSKTAEALAWAKANPNDPRSKEILKRLGQ